MNREEIKDKIAINNRRIQELSTPSFFTLNKEISQLLEENAHLREMCEHEYNEENVCIWCGRRGEK